MQIGTLVNINPARITHNDVLYPAAKCQKIFRITALTDFVATIKSIGKASQRLIVMDMPCLDLLVVIENGIFENSK